MSINLGHYSEGGTPVPISNTAVKPFSAYGTSGLPWWESRSWPSLILKNFPFNDFRFKGYNFSLIYIFIFFIAFIPCSFLTDEFVATINSSVGIPFLSLSSSSSIVSLVTSDGTYFYVESDGIALHNMMTGIMAWNQRVPLPQDFTSHNNFRFPLTGSVH